MEFRLRIFAAQEKMHLEDSVFPEPQQASDLYGVADEHFRDVMNCATRLKDVVGASHQGSAALVRYLRNRPSAPNLGPYPAFVIHSGSGLWKLFPQPGHLHTGLRCSVTVTGFRTSS